MKWTVKLVAEGQSSVEHEVITIERGESIPPGTLVQPLLCVSAGVCNGTRFESDRPIIRRPPTFCRTLIIPNNNAPAENRASDVGSGANGSGDTPSALKRSIVKWLVRDAYTLL